jgi:hypothetical protein
MNDEVKKNPGFWKFDSSLRKKQQKKVTMSNDERKREFFPMTE